MLYRRVTLAIRQAVIDGVFTDGSRIEALDVAFAKRYFNALNAYFHPDQSRGPTLPWKVAFVGDQDGKAIILQHMMAGLNAHITFDLGIAVFETAAHSLRDLKPITTASTTSCASRYPTFSKSSISFRPTFARPAGWYRPRSVSSSGR